MQRRNSAVFTIFVSVLMLLGAGLMALVLALSGAPGALVIGVVLAALPVGPLVGAYMWLDRYEPEPRSLLLLGLGWGAFVATSGALVLQEFDKAMFRSTDVWSGVVAAPVTEEAAKGLFIVLLLIFRRHELDGILDGLVYAGMVGIGFAFTENILYLASAYMGEDGQSGGLQGAIGLFVIRGIFSPFAHPLFTAFTGIGVGIAVTSRSGLVRVVAPVLGYVCAVTAHALWNGSLMLDEGRNALTTYVFLMLPAFFLFVGFAVWARRREGKVLVSALDDCARRGFLNAAEIPWLARIPARRFCRNYAAKAGGPQARKVMKDYQDSAIELGFLHHRYLRGTAPKDFAEAGQFYVRRMEELRPHLVWPQRQHASAPGVGPAPLESQHRGRTP